MSKCAACGKGGDNLKVCTSCEQVKYCNAKCRNTHRSKHKKECKKLAAERHNCAASFGNLSKGVSNICISTESSVTAADKKTSISCEQQLVHDRIISDEELFADPPPKEDCDICFLPTPYSTGFSGEETTYQPCCGKTLCNGCVMASDDEMKKGSMKSCCPFCRVPLPSTNNERVERVKKRVEMNDPFAIYNLGRHYCIGDLVPKDSKRGLDLLYQSAELGLCHAHFTLGIAYLQGGGVEKDMKRAFYHWKLAAIGGHETARYNLGCMEGQKGNAERACKHLLIAARSGHDDSLKAVGNGYRAGHVTKDVYASTLRAYKDSRDEMKSEQRKKDLNFNI